MGLIVDLEFPHVLPQIKRQARRGAAAPKPAPGEAHSSIHNDTPLVPRAAAEAIWEEACRFSGEALPRAWVALLVEKAETIYTRPGSFRRRMRGAGHTGRDWLWAFMRHWMTALVQRHRPAAFARLPSRYAVGVSIDAN